MNILYAMFFGAGTAALAYSTLGRRVGYSNSQNIVYFLVAVFVIASLFFYTILAFILHS